MATSCKTALYRHYDEHSVLLYIGISDRLSDRTRSHARSSQWKEYVDHSSAAWYNDRSRAEIAEIAAIHAEKPVFNVMGAVGNTSERIEKYLTLREFMSARLSRKDTLRIVHDAADKDEIRSKNLVSLREAVLERVVGCTLNTLKNCRSRDEAFPKVAAFRGSTQSSEHLYFASELRTWDNNRYASKRGTS